MAIAAVGFLVWGHHMFLSGQSEAMGAIFSFITFGVAVPTAIKVCSWIATLYKGNIRWNTVMMYTLGFLWFHYWWIDWFAVGNIVYRCSPSRYLLCGRSLPLYDDGWCTVRIDHWYLPLVAKDDW